MTDDEIDRLWDAALNCEPDADHVMEFARAVAERALAGVVRVSPADAAVVVEALDEVRCERQHEIATNWKRLSRPAWLRVQRAEVATLERILVALRAEMRRCAARPLNPNPEPPPR